MKALFVLGICFLLLACAQGVVDDAPVDEVGANPAQPDVYTKEEVDALLDEKVDLEQLNDVRSSLAELVAELDVLSEDDMNDILSNCYIENKFLTKSGTCAELCAERFDVCLFGITTKGGYDTGIEILGTCDFGWEDEDFTRCLCCNEK